MLIGVSSRKNSFFLFSLILCWNFSCSSEKLPEVIYAHDFHQEYVDSKFLIYCWHLIDESSSVGDKIAISNNPLQFFDCIIQNGEIKKLIFTWKESTIDVTNSILFEDRKIVGLGIESGIIDISQLNLAEDNNYTKILKEKYNRFGEKMNPWLKNEFNQRNLVP